MVKKKYQSLIKNNKYLVLFANDTHGDIGEREFIAKSSKEALDLAWSKIDNHNDYPAAVYLQGHLIWER